MQQSTAQSLTPHEKTAIAQKVTFVGMMLDVVLGIIKIIVGSFSNSVALIADGIHSFTDVITDIMVLMVTRYSRQAPDEEHPYGHERFETLGTVFLGSTLIAIAGAMAWDSLIRLFSGNNNLEVGWIALIAAGISIAGKEYIFHYTMEAAKKINSNLLVANAWHSRTDAISSIVVFIALVGALFGMPWLDAVAACIVGIIIGKIGWQLAWDNIKVLVDTAPSTEETEQLHRVIMATDGVKSVHSLRCRHMGDELLLDVHLQVASSISVSEGHQIGLVVCKRLRESFDHIKDITYHIDAEDDDHYHSHQQQELPLRSEIIPALQKRWANLLDFELASLRFHYLNNQIQIEIFTQPTQSEKITDSRALIAELENEAKDLPWLGPIVIWRG